MAIKIKIDRADKLFSEYIRLRDNFQCQKCGRFFPEGKGLQCSHYWSRSHENTRFDGENAIAVCAGCHLFFHGNPGDYYQFMINRLGKEKYDKLQLRSNAFKKKRDRVLEIERIKILIKELENEKDK